MESKIFEFKGKKYILVESDIGCTACPFVGSKCHEAPDDCVEEQDNSPNNKILIYEELK